MRSATEPPTWIERAALMWTPSFQCFNLEVTAVLLPYLPRPTPVTPCLSRSRAGPWRAHMHQVRPLPQRDGDVHEFVAGPGGATGDGV